MLLVDEIAQIIRINDKKIGAGQTAELIIDLLAKEGYGKMVMPDCKYVAGFRLHPNPVFEPIK